MDNFNAGVRQKGAEEHKEDTQDTLFCKCLRQNKKNTYKTYKYSINTWLMYVRRAVCNRYEGLHTSLTRFSILQLYSS